MNVLRLIVELGPWYALATFVLGLLCAIPGVLYGRHLWAKGIVQDYKVKPVVLTVFIITIARYLFVPVPIVVLFVLGVLFSTQGVYRSDWDVVRSKGNWWWHEKANRENPWVISLGVILLTCGIVAVIWLVAKH